MKQPLDTLFVSLHVAARKRVGDRRRVFQGEVVW
jgi:hypothetical protein